MGGDRGNGGGENRRGKDRGEWGEKGGGKGGRRGERVRVDIAE